MNMSDGEPANIDEKGKILIEKAKEAININKEDTNRNQKIEIAMNELYEYFSTYPEEELQKFSLQLEIFKVERMLENEFLPLDSEPIFDPNDQVNYPDKITSQNDCEEALKFLVYSVRTKLAANIVDLKNNSLEKMCIDTSWSVEKICETLNIDYTHLGLNQNLNNGMFHHFTIVKFPIDNEQYRSYLVDCTYRQFFIKSDSFLRRISVMRGPAKGASIGTYMMMTEDRKTLAEQLLTQGYIEATPENLKTYFDAIIFSGRDNEFYKSNGIDYMNPNDCMPNYSIDDYISILMENKTMETVSITSAAKEILSSRSTLISTSAINPNPKLESKEGERDAK